MRFLRHNRRAALLIGAGLVVALVAVVLMVRGSGSPTSASNSVTGTSPSTGSTGGSTVPLPKTGRKKPHSVRRTAAAAPTLPAAAGVGGGSVTGVTGFTGSGYSKDAPRHTVTLVVTTPQSAPTAVGWWVPTDPSTKQGSAKYVGARWSHTAHAYGSPDYARLLVIAGGAGIPVTCTIEVDGRVVDRRTTAHAYGEALCQG